MNKKDFENSETIINLCRAFLMESQNGSRYRFMAEKASEEKYCYLDELLIKTAKKCNAQAKVFYMLIEENQEQNDIEIEFDDVYPFR